MFAFERSLHLRTQWCGILAGAPCTNRDMSFESLLLQFSAAGYFYITISSTIQAFMLHAIMADHVREAGHKLVGINGFYGTALLCDTFDE